MSLSQSVTAIKHLAAMACVSLATSVLAGPIGQVSNLSGPLFALNSQGAKRVLSIGSDIEAGDTLITEDKTYAQIRFADKGVVTLKPGTQFKVESFAFDEKAPEKDGAVFGLIKGALRTLTGLVGKRGNQDAYRMNTPTATIGIRGTGYNASICPGPGCGNLPSGTYVDVFDGQVAMSPPPVPNQALTPPLPPLLLSAGQFGHAPPPAVGPPQQLPGDPGLGKNLTPPANFISGEQPAPPGGAGGGPGQPPASQRQSGPGNQGDCVVR